MIFRAWECKRRVKRILQGSARVFQDSCSRVSRFSFSVPWDSESRCRILMTVLEEIAVLLPLAPHVQGIVQQPRSF